MSQPVVYALATALGAFSVFPTLPAVMESLQQSALFSWFCVFTLIWQGGGGRNLIFSLILTLILFLVHTALTYMEKIH